MRAKQRTARRDGDKPGLERSRTLRATGRGLKPGRRRGHVIPLMFAAVLVLASAAAGTYLAYDQYRAHRLARTVRQSFASQRYREAREPLRRWLAMRPRAAEA